MQTNRLVSFLLITVFCLSAFLVGCPKQDEAPETVFEYTKIAYIPLDNRPCNKERVEFLAESAGFELLMPDEDLYRTALDNMEKNENGTTYGDREKLLDWIKSVEDECDQFVISLDQMFSGGLVSSRWLDNEDLTLETEIADYLIELSKDNYVVYFDTVMRLASTVDYQGYKLEEYNNLRSYGSVERKLLSGDELTIENIVAGYRYDKDGNAIATAATEEQLKQYHAARTRKLKLVDYLLKNAADDIDHLYIGVDDSSPNYNIQSNEKNYIKKLGGDILNLFTGADELGVMGIAAVASFVYGDAECNVSYFGDGKDKIADSFDDTTLAQNVNHHLSAIGATSTSDDENALQILVLTQTEGMSFHTERLVNQLKSNIEKGIPTCVINCSNQWDALSEPLLNDDYDIGKLLGYSGWNTVSNSVGISVSNAVSRYVYLQNAEEITEKSNEGFLKTLTFSLVKDLSYRARGSAALDLTESTSYDSPATIVNKINASEIMVGKDEYASHKAVKLSNFRQPWNRAFEATFDITVE